MLERSWLLASPLASKVTLIRVPSSAQSKRADRCGREVRSRITAPGSQRSRCAGSATAS